MPADREVSANRVSSDLGKRAQEGQDSLITCQTLQISEGLCKRPTTYLRCEMAPEYLDNLPAQLETQSKWRPLPSSSMESMNVWHLRIFGVLPMSFALFYFDFKSTFFASPIWPSRAVTCRTHRVGHSGKVSTTFRPGANRIHVMSTQQTPRTLSS